MKTILHLCADIGSDSKIYQDAGYNVILVGKDIGVENYYPPENVYGIIANPVCTEFSRAKTRNGNLEQGMILVNHCLRIIKEADPVFHVIENPATGDLRKFLGKPDYTYEPWNFGSPWSKRTGLWGKFNNPIKTYTKWEDVAEKNHNLYIKPRDSKPSMAALHKSAKKHIKEFDCFAVEDDMSFRSLCSQNFAKAFFEANL